MFLITIQELEEKYKAHVPTVLGVTEHYGVLVPLVEWDEGPSLLFEVRAGTLRRQPGEVCFPGGKVELGEDPVSCALRETEEELGIPPSAVRPIAPLDAVYHQTNFLLHPVLAQVEPEAVLALHPSTAEVADTFLVPLRFFEETSPLIHTYELLADVGEDFPYDRIGRTEYHWKGGRVEVPIWNWGPHAIWGMTGRIVRALVGR